MVFLSVTNCPPSLRGDLSKWLNEINTGVYIGKLSGRVREELWKRICEHIKDGQATMVYSAANAQGFEILVHNTSWTPKDYDGITLMKRPHVQPADSADRLKAGFSKAAKYRMAAGKKKGTGKSTDSYVILDLETTGLDFDSDRIIEIGMLKIEDGEVAAKYECLVNPEREIPKNIENLTGISDTMIQAKAKEEKEALEEAQRFIGTRTVVGYNVKFDLNFISSACSRYNFENRIRKAKDVLTLARRKIERIDNYKLATVAEYFGIEIAAQHRALEDCKVVYRIYSKLNEL